MKSFFDDHTIQDVLDEIKDVYLSHTKPWVIGYSGGKDSTAVLQLVWTALEQLNPEERQKQVFVIASDTKVETPVIVDYIDSTLHRVNEAARETGMPFQAQKVMPNLDESFWVNLLGRGYPAPTIKFRWCTERMKINPANRFIQDKVGAYGEVIMVLGTRKSESATRAQLMNTYKVKGHSRLRYHKYLSGAYIYAPIADFITDDVWSYLLANESPWGSNNRDLSALYRNASGECPLVIDDSTPSCGNSRFGCWVCTVVERDISMGHMIDNGEEWLEPLLEFRDHLAATRNHPDYRSIRGRDGTVRVRNGEALRGSYNFRALREYLELLLKAQKAIREKDPDATLISDEELIMIRRLWRTEGIASEIDIEDDIPKIFRKVHGYDLDWPEDDDDHLSPEKSAIMAEVCAGEGIPVNLLVRLYEAERNAHGMARRAGIHKTIQSELSRYLNAEKAIEATAA